MSIKKPEPKKQERSLTMPLIMAAGILVVIAIIVFAAGKVQSKDPTLTAAPPTGVPGQIYHASPEKMAKQREIQARMNAEIAGMKSASH